MKFTLKTLSAAAAMLAAGVANATLVTVSVGDAPLIVADPAGQLNAFGFVRAASFELLSGSGTLKFSNPGVNFSATDASAISGAVGALNTGAVFLNASGGLSTQETWKSYASSGPGFESTVFATKAAADADPANAQYYNSGEISTANTQSFRLASAAGGNVSVKAKIDNNGNDGAYSSASIGQITTANAIGNMTMSAVQNAALTGGTINVTDVTFDLYAGKVTATVSGTRNAVGKVTAQTYAPQTLTLWTFAGVTAGSADILGPSGVKPASLLSSDPVAALTADGYSAITQVGTNAAGFGIYQGAANTTISNLNMTAAALTYFKTVLNTNATGSAAIDAVNNAAGKWGTVTSNLVMRVQEVPEPSTYALMGLGLVGISLVARRRSATV